MQAIMTESTYDRIISKYRYSTGKIHSPLLWGTYLARKISSDIISFETKRLCQQYDLSL